MLAPTFTCARWRGGVVDARLALGYDPASRHTRRHPRRVRRRGDLMVVRHRPVRGGTEADRALARSGAGRIRVAISDYDVDVTCDRHWRGMSILYADAVWSCAHGA
jgi:hypothetical protein